MTRPHHRLHVPDIDDRPGPLTVAGEEAHHAARVKRLRPGEAVELFDGRGAVRAGSVTAIAGSRTHPEVVIEPFGPTRRVEPARPRVVVCCPIPKGDRLEQMIDQLSQAGAAAWRALACERGEGGDHPRRPERLGRIAVESAKQCGRAHLLEIAEPVGFEQALVLPGVVLADGSGQAGAAPRGPEVTLLVGPEGGWTERELHLARSRAVPLLRLGPHVLRLETAAVVGAALLMSTGGEP